MSIFFEILMTTGMLTVFEIIIDSLEPIDILFYIFALYYGYSASFRKIEIVASTDSHPDFESENTVDGDTGAKSATAADGTKSD